MILGGELTKRLKMTFEEIAEKYEFEIETMEVKDDHVHLFCFCLRLLGILRQKFSRS